MKKKGAFSTIKKRQQILVGGIGCLVMGGMCLYGWVALREAPLQHKQEFKSAITTGTGRTNPQEAWVYQFTQEAQLTQKRLDAMQETLQKMMKMAESKMTETPKSPSPKPPEASRLNSLREDIQKEIQDPPNVKLDASLPPPPGNGQTPEVSPDVPGNSTPSPSFRSKSVRKISLSLRNARKDRPLKTVDNTIPAGAFAKAILLGGVDASASIQASSDPRPALLRLVDAGTLPRKFRSDLKGCHVLAACYGDISSERVFMRLEKLTCTERKTGEIVEVKVQGYVAGEDGRTGIRGTMVDRAGESMRHAMMGGFVSGLGDFLSQSRNTLTFAPLAGLAQPSPMNVGEMMKHGAGKGVSSALDKYADFYIKRAEQVQPVIQVAAGRQVDIVFTEGVSLNDTLYRQALGKAHDQGRYQQIQALSEESSLSPPPVSEGMGNSPIK